MALISPLSGKTVLRFQMTVLKNLFFVLAILFVPDFFAMAEPFDDAVAAYEQGDYQKSEREFRTLAGRAHTGAETMLGVMYFHGRGVEENKAYAAIWFYKAARKGNASAQLAFGSLHIRGVGVRQNVAKAYRWLSLASRRSDGSIHDEAERLKSEIANLLPESERRKISEDIKSWRQDANWD